MKIKHRFLSLILFPVLIVLLPLQIFAGNIESFEVDGLKVIFKKNTANQIVGINLFIQGGSMNLSPETAGLENFALSVAQKATKNYPKEKLNLELDRMNTRIFTSSSNDYSTVQMQCVVKYFDKSWDIFQDILRNPLIDPNDVELVRQQILLSIKQRKDSPDRYLRKLVNDVFYKDHPYAISPLGEEETVSKFTADDLKKYLKENLTKSRLLLVIVGNLDREQLEKAIRTSLAKLPEGNYRQKFPPVVNHVKPSVLVVEKELPTNYIMGLFSAPSIREDDYFPMSIAASILGQRVFEEIRTKRNLSYSPHAGLLFNFSNSGYLYVTTVKPDTTIKVMLNEVDRLQTELITPKELKNKINVFLTQYYLANETNLSQARMLGVLELSGRGWQFVDKLMSAYRQVTPQDVQRVAKKYIKNIQFAVLGNPDLIKEQTFTAK